MVKVKACLGIMEESLGDNKKRKNLDVMSGSSHARIPQSVTSAQVDQAPPAKKKRGKASMRHQLLLQDGDDSEVNAESVHVARASTRNLAPTKTNGVNAKSAAATTPNLTLQQLVTRFEEKYEEMGQQYTEMGNLLAQMKTALEEGREKTEQQIRSEVLEEVQKCMPKK
jgi:hypothetical protein